VNYLANACTAAVGRRLILDRRIYSATEVVHRVEQEKPDLHATLVRYYPAAARAKGGFATVLFAKC
jgi:hypothetical protein